MNRLKYLLLVRKAWIIIVALLLAWPVSRGLEVLRNANNNVDVRYVERNATDDNNIFSYIKEVFNNTTTEVITTNDDNVYGALDNFSNLLKALTTRVTNLEQTKSSVSVTTTPKTASSVTPISASSLTLASIITEIKSILDDVGSGNTQSGAYLIGTYDEFANSDAINVQDVLDDLDNDILNLENSGFITETSTNTLTNKTIGTTGLSFTGATIDITTGSNQDLIISPNGSGIVKINSSLELSSTIKISGGSPGASKVLTSDANGLASWETINTTTDTDTAGTTSTTSSNSGLETASDGVSLLRGCSDNQILKWDSGSSIWQCEADSGSGGGTLDIEEGDALIVSAASIVDFLASDFIVTNSPSGEGNISIDYSNSGITRKGQNETISGNWTFTNGISVGSTAVVTNLNADYLDSQSGAYYLSRANHTGTQTVATISDFDTEVGNHTDVSANTSARHSAITVSDTSSVNLTLTDQLLSAVVLPAGVDHDSLLNFVANEHLDWTNATSNFDTTGTIQVGTSNVTITNASGYLLESAIADGALLARLSADETVTGNWTFTNGISVGSTSVVTGLNADYLDSQSGAYYLSRTNHTGTQTVATISDFDTEVSNNSDVSANTSARHSAITVSDTSSVNLTLTDQLLSAAILPAGVDHDSLLNYVANEHLDWTNATADLSTSGSISASSIGIGTTDPSYALDIVGELNLTDAVRVAGDAGTNGYLLTSSAGGAMTWTNPTDITGTTYSVSGALTLVGDTLGLNETLIDHDNLSGFVANEHLDWTNATSNFDTTGTIQVGTSNVTITNASGYILESSIADGALLARLSANETVSGNWTFTNSISVGSTAVVTNLNADYLDSQSGSYYLSRANHTGTQTVATISDFDTEVSNNADVSANTSARHSAVTVSDTSSVNLTLTDQLLSAVVLPAGVDHDSLLNFSANEHIDWTNATANLSTSGSVLSSSIGIGTTDPSYALDIVGELNLTDAIRVAGDAGTNGYLLTSSAGGVNTWTNPDSITGTTYSVSGALTLVGDTLGLNETLINHDNLSGFVSDEHVAHTGVTLTAGVGLSGGGNISANRTFTIDLNELTTETSIAAGDFISMVDITDSGSGKITFANLESTLNHDSLAGFVTNEHLDWTNATSNFDTTGTIQVGTSNVTITNASGYLLESAIADGAFLARLSADETVSGNWTFTNGITVGSTSPVTNLNADLLDSQHGAYYLNSANFTGTNWTDLTDSGDTTLHDHDGISENTSARHSAITVSDTSSVNLTLTDQLLSAAILPAGVDHDSLLNYSANEHIDWTNASSNLATSGNITAANIGIGTTNPSYALDIVGELNLTDAIRVAGDAGTSGYLLTSSAGGAMTWTDPASITGTTYSVSGALTLVGNTLGLNETLIDHDNLSGFVSDEHIAHTGVTFTAGVGLSGGGDISANRTFTVDLNELTTETSIAAGDFISMVDITDSGSGKITFANLESTLNHDSLAGFVSNEHLDWTNATSNFDTTGTIQVGTSNVTITNASGYILETSIADGALLARLSADETVSGNWTFTNSISVGSTAVVTNLNADYLDSQSGAYYLSRANHTGTQTASTISDFDTEVSNNTDVAANTSARHSAITVSDTSSVNLTLTDQLLSAAILPAGVDHDSLLNFVANEHIDWTNSSSNFDTTGTIQVGTSNVTITNASGYVLESAIADGALLARLSADETVLGSWTFSDTMVVADINLTNAININGDVGTNGYVLTSSAGGAMTWTNPNTIGGSAYSVDSGLTLVGSTISLGGSLTANTRVNVGSTEVLYFKFSTGNVGIGNTNPSYKLDLTGELNLTDAIRVAGDAGTNGYLLTSSAGGSMTWTDPNSIIGTTYSTANGLTLTGNTISLGGALTSNTTITQDAAETLTFANNGSGNITFNLASSGDFDVQDNGVSALWVGSDGYVGIGITVPNALFNVYGSSGNEFRLNAGGYFDLYRTSNQVRVDPYSGSGGKNGALISTGNGNGLALGGVMDTVHMSIKSSGNVGIGTTNPGYELEVVGDINLNAYTDDYYIGGSQVLSLGASGVTNTILGVSAGLNHISGADDNTLIGRNAGKGVMTSAADKNTFVGSDSGLSITQGYENTSIGYRSLYNLTTGDYNVGLGSYAAYNLTTGNNNTALGKGSLQTAMTTSADNAAVGYQAMNNSRYAYYNSALGSKALYYNYDGNYNAAVGMEAGYGVSGNTFSNSSLLGYRAGYALTTGSNNILLGYKAADNLTTGANNIVIGYDIDAPAVDSSQTLNIGNLIYATGLDGVGATMSTGNLGIGTTAPGDKLDISGGLRFSGNGSFSSGVAQIYRDSSYGLILSGYAGSQYDFTIADATGTFLMNNPQGTSNLTLVQGGSGNVGIGTSNPGYKLEVVGDINILGATSAIRVAGDAGTNGYLLTSAGAGGAMTWTDPSSLGGSGLWIENGSDIGFTAGNVGIGTTAPSQELEVVGDIKLSGNLMFGNMSSSASTTEGSVYYDTDTDHLFIYGGDAAWHRLSMDMTKYTATGTTVASGSYIEIAHNQSTNDLSAVGWFYDTVDSLWKTIDNFTTTLKHNLLEDWDDGPATGVILTENDDVNAVKLAEVAAWSTGLDGDITVSSNKNINTDNLIAGRSCADGGDAVNYSVDSLSSTTATLTSSPSTGCLNTGDEVLLINLRGIGTSYPNVGNYETLKVLSVVGALITFTTEKTNYYGDGESDDTNIGVTNTEQYVMLQRVPNYDNVTINGSQTFSASDWGNGNDADEGPKGGVMFFRANGTVTVTGTISTTGLGYDGPYENSSTNYLGGSGGEAFCGPGGLRADPSGVGGDGAAGAGGGYYHTPGHAGGDGSCGGGGGAAGVGSAASGGSGGGGSGLTGGGGGAGYGTAGTGGLGGSAGLQGEDGGTNTSGDGPAASTYGTGAGGGGTYGVANLSKMYFGSAGGQGSDSGTTGDPGAGGDGGGIIYISANSITVTGSIQANGNVGGNCVGSGTNFYCGSGGGGAGGSVKLAADSLVLGSDLVTATGGTGGTTGYYYNAYNAFGDGGAGGDGRVAVEYVTSTSGSADPAIGSSTVGSPPSLSISPYGVYHSGVISTPNATFYDKLRWGENLDTYGKISFQTRSGNSTDPTDGTWEAWKPYTVTTNYIDLANMNTHTDWTASSATLAEGDVTRNIDYFENEDEATATNLTKITTSTNGGYIEETISSTDLSDFDYITMWVRASQTGSSLKFGIGESAATEEEQTIAIETADTWQKIYWDISSITDADINAVTKLRLTNLVSVGNTIYLDNIRAEQSLMEDKAGSIITSTPNNYFQYRAIFTTTNTGYQPALENVYFDYKNGFKTVQVDADTVRLYNYSGSTQNLRLDTIIFGADLAEWYTVADDSIEAGDVVATTGKLDEYGVPILTKATKDSDRHIIGAISTRAGQELGIETADRRLLGLTGRIPIKIDPLSPEIKNGDLITASPNTPGLGYKAEPGDIVIGKAFVDWIPPEDGSISNVLVYILEPREKSFVHLTLDKLKDIVITPEATSSASSSAKFKLTSLDSDSSALTQIASFSQAIIANLKAGSITAIEAQVESLKIGTQTLAEYIVSIVQSALDDGQLESTLISSTGDSTEPVLTQDSLGNITIGDTNTNVGIGVTNPVYKLQVGTEDNYGFVNDQGAWSVANNITSEVDITNLEDSLAKILTLEPIRYNNNNIGFNANDLEITFPELVSTDPNTGIKGISYSLLTPVLVKGMQEQQLLISGNSDALLNVSGDLTTQEQEIASLEQRIRGLEDWKTSEINSQIAGVATDSSEATASANILEEQNGVWYFIKEMVFKLKVIFLGDTEFSGFALFKDKVKLENDISVEGELKISQDVFGQITIPAGKTKVKLIFTKEFSDIPMIVLTPVGKFNSEYSLEEIDVDHFIIKISEPQSEDVQFSWQVVIYNEGSEKPTVEVIEEPEATTSATPVATSSAGVQQ